MCVQFCFASQPPQLMSSHLRRVHRETAAMLTLSLMIVAGKLSRE